MRVAIIGPDGLIEAITNVEPVVLPDLPPNHVPNVPDHVDDLTHRWDVLRGAFVELPPRPDAPHYWRHNTWNLYPPQPHPSATWDEAAEQWIDPRTSADRQAELHAARNAASLDKSALLMRLALPDVGILSADEAIEAAQGRIPASFQPAIATLPPEAQMLARIKWAGDQIISRTNPLLILAAYAKGISDEQMDQIFGVVAPA